MKPDKATQLQQFLGKRETTTFSWGGNDCALFAANWVLERTGKDYAAEFRGTYHTETGSVQALNNLGYDNLTDALHQLLGQPLEAPGLAQRGDVALVDTPLGIACGVVTVNGVLAQGYRSLKLISFSKMIAAWRIE